MTEIDEQLDEIGEAFGISKDPLKKYESVFEKQLAEIDPFDMYIEGPLSDQGLTENTLRMFEAVFREWKEHMKQEGRHPACPNERHVQSFVQSQEDNKPGTIKLKLQRLNKIFKYWQAKRFPHTDEYNPFASVLETNNFERGQKPQPPRIPIDTLGEIVQDIPYIREQAFISIQLKLGLRGGELCNLKLSDVDIQNESLQTHYPRIGTHPAITEWENAIYIPSREERDGNKSRRSRVLPLDGETRRVLLRWLLIRPDTENDWLFLSKQSLNQLPPEYVNEQWKAVFRPEYDGSDGSRPVTSHFGRHRFTTYWQVEQDFNRNLVKYMRGDTINSFEGDDSIDAYIHTYYQDIESVYRRRIFQLGI